MMVMRMMTLMGFDDILPDESCSLTKGRRQKKTIFFTFGQKGGGGSRPIQKNLIRKYSVLLPFLTKN